MQKPMGSLVFNTRYKFQIIFRFKFLKKICDGRESNPNQLLGRQLC